MFTDLLRNLFDSETARMSPVTKKYIETLLIVLNNEKKVDENLFLILLECLGLSVARDVAVLMVPLLYGANKMPDLRIFEFRNDHVDKVKLLQLDRLEWPVGSIGRTLVGQSQVSIWREIFYVKVAELSSSSREEIEDIRILRAWKKVYLDSNMRFLQEASLQEGLQSIEEVLVRFKSEADLLGIQNWPNNPSSSSRNRDSVSAVAIRFVLSRRAT
jgi:hypothetical protein